MQGWFKVKRGIFQDPIIGRDAQSLAIWIYLLENMSFGEFDIMFSKSVITLKRGQMVTTLGEISRVTGVKVSKVNRVLKKLKSEKRIDIATDMQKSLITLGSEWLFIGDDEKGNEKRVKNERKTKQDRENEKEKSSKREKDKEKEKIKNVKNVSVCMDTQKLPYGTYENVFLTPEWYEEFCTEHSKAVANRVINRLSVYKKAKEIENVNDEPYLIQDAPKRRMPTYGDADECFEAAIARTYAEDDDEYGF